MRELAQIDSLASHTCEALSVERWHVFEPISGRWQWLRVFACCGNVYEEPASAESLTHAPGEGREARRAA